MKNKNYLKLNSLQWISVGFSFLIPLAVMLLCFMLRGIAPFGSKTLCSMDGFSQYYPMLMNMGEAFKDGELLYSFSGALGFNLWAQSAYYTNSPLWILVYILPESMKILGIHFLIVLKICLSGAFFCFRLIKNRPDAGEKHLTYIFPALSCAWALSGYVVAFINQLMWADVIMLLPLVILGIEEIVRRKNPILYIGALALSIWCCFYLSYMVCLFAVLYFLFLIFKEKYTFKKMFSLCVIFGAGSLIAGALTAVSLYPTVKALSLTYASQLGFEGDIEIKYTLVEFLKRFLPMQKISLEYGEPNLFCSLTAVIAFVLGLFSKSTTVRERVLSLLFVSFVSITMCTNLGEFVWHGFHYPNQLPARQSFLLIFLILAFCEKGLEWEKIPDAISKIACVVVILSVGLSATHQILSQTWASNIDSLQGNDVKMNALAYCGEKDVFSRMEWTDVNKNNYPQQYSYNGIGYYSSTMSADAWFFFQNLGMSRYADKVSTHYNSSPVLDALFGVKYVLNEQGDTININENVLSLAYLSDEAIKNYSFSFFDTGAASQNALFLHIQLDKNENFNDSVKRLRNNDLDISYFDTDVIKGSINCERDGVFLTTIPYDGGWKIIIDGKEAKTFKAAEYLTACDITKGSHEIEMRYTVPGIKAGALISTVALILYIALIFMQYKTKKEDSIKEP